MTTRSCRMSSSTTTSVSCSASIAALNFGATRVTNARFASPHDVQIHRASSSDSRLRCAPKTRMTAPNGLVEVGSLLVEAIIPAGEASTVEELTYARVAYLHAAHSPEPTSRDPVLDVRISWSTGLPHAAHTGTLALPPIFQRRAVEGRSITTSWRRCRCHPNILHRGVARLTGGSMSDCSPAQ